MGLVGEPDCSGFFGWVGLGGYLSVFLGAAFDDFIEYLRIISLESSTQQM